MVESVEEKKVFIEGVVREGDGVVCTTAEVIFCEEEGFKYGSVKRVKERCWKYNSFTLWYRWDVHYSCACTVHHAMTCPSGS
ncbi:hypothetical protein BDW66DRAFT_2005 [Aspergillus desertorum]